MKIDENVIINSSLKYPSYSARIAHLKILNYNNNYTVVSHIFGIYFKIRVLLNLTLYLSLKKHLKLYINMKVQSNTCKRADIT